MRRAPVAAVLLMAALAATQARAGAKSTFVAYHGVLLSQEPARAPHNSAVDYRGAVPAYRVVYTGHRAGEPTIGVDARGVAYVAAGVVLANPGTVHTPLGSANTQQQSALFLASTDGGRTWHPDEAELAPGVGAHPWFFDPYVYVEPSNGRVFEGTLTDAGGSYFESRDQGGSWTRANMYVPGVNDHETVFAGPPPEGLSAPDVVYYCVNQLVDAACARSIDGGKTFVPTGGVLAVPAQSAGGPAGNPADVRETQVGPYNAYCEGLTGHGVVDPAGRVFVPWSCYGPWISWSSDAGASWHPVRVAPGSSIGTAPRTVHTSMAVDSAGNLYAVWWDQKYLLPFLSISRDHGAHWSTPRMVAPPGVTQVNFVTVGAGGEGRIALSFLGTAGAGSATAWNLYTVLSTGALSPNPTFLSTVTNPGGPTDPVHRGACQGACGSMLDYLDEPAVAPDAHGTVWVAGVDTCTGACAHGGPDLDDAQGYVVHQLSGPWLR